MLFALNKKNIFNCCLEVIIWNNNINYHSNPDYMYCNKRFNLSSVSTQIKSTFTTAKKREKQHKENENEICNRRFSLVNSTSYKIHYVYQVQKFLYYSHSQLNCKI